MTRSYLLPTLEPLESRLVFGAGDLDPALNHAALVSTEFPGGSSVVSAMQILPDGGILAGGTVRVIEGNTLTAQTKLFLARYQFDGSLDPSFGMGGKIVNTPRSMSSAERIQLTPDGGFLVMGGSHSYPGPVSSEFLLKFTKTGKVDTRSGKNGVLKPPGLNTFTVDPHGRILVGGARGHAGTPKSSIASDATLARYTGAGMLDTTFNNTGQFVFLNPGVGTEESRIQVFRSIAIDNDHRIVAAMEIFSTFGGDNLDGVAYSDTRMFRLSDSGEVDAGYGGVEILYLRHIAGLLDDGSALLIGRTIARVDPTGHLDTTYGNNGVANTSKLGLTPSDFLVQAKDRAVVTADGGIVFANVATDGSLELTRINPQGQPDVGFGTAGTLTLATDTHPDALGYLGAVALAPDGSIVFGGQTGIVTPKSAASRDLNVTPSVTVATDTRTAVVGRVMSSAGPAVQLVPRTLRTSTQSLYVTVLIRDVEGVDVSTLDDDDLKLIDAAGEPRRFRFVSSEDVYGDGTYIAARYRITAPGASAWTSGDNGIFQARLQRRQIADGDANRAVAQVLGPVFVKIA